MKHRRPSYLPGTAAAMMLMAGSILSARFDRPDGDPPAPGGGGAGGPSDNEKKLREELVARDAQLAELNAKITDLSKNTVSDADKKELDKLKKEKTEAENKRLLEQGELKKLLDTAQSALATAEQNAAQAKADADARIRDMRLTNFLTNECPKHTDVPADQIIAALRLADWFVDNPATPGAFMIQDPITKTTPRNAKGNPMTPEEFVADKISKTPWAAAVKPKGGSGSQSQTGAGTGANGEYSPEDIRNMSIDEFNKNKKKIFAQADANTRHINPLPKAAAEA